VSVHISLDSCLLRPLVPGDAATLAQHANDRDIWLNLRDRFPHPYTVEDAAAYIDAVAEQHVRTTFGLIVDGEPAGSISLMLGHDIERASAEIGYWLGRAFWGRGVVTQAVRAVTHYAFSSIALHRVFAIPFTHNHASARVLEKCGYVHEGVMRRSAIKNGQILDQHLYAAYDDVPLR
jgi:ribosomal-protein-alanine N-acetyltransferase